MNGRGHDSNFKSHGSVTALELRHGRIHFFALALAGPVNGLGKDGLARILWGSIDMPGLVGFNILFFVSLLMRSQNDRRPGDAPMLVTSTFDERPLLLHNHLGMMHIGMRVLYFVGANFCAQMNSYVRPFRS